MRVLLISILCCIMLQGHTQKLVRTFYNDSWLLTSKKKATYCRVGFLDTVTYSYYGAVNDYYLKTGKLQMSGNYIGSVKNGAFKFFYPNGIEKSSGNYVKNVKDGVWTSYYENGSFRDKLLYSGSDVIPITFYDSTGVQKLNQGTGQWRTEYFDDIGQEQIIIDCYFQDSLREGEWNFYVREMLGDSLGIPLHTRIETYHQGKLISGKGYVNEKVVDRVLPTIQLVGEPTKFYTTENWLCTQYACIEEYPFLKFLPKLDSTKLPVDSLAEFPGGLQAFENKIALNKGLQKVGLYSYNSTYQFVITIDNNGKLSFTTRYNYSDDFYKEIIRILKKQPAWKAAIRNNKNVTNYFALVVNLKDGLIRVKMASLNEIEKPG